MNALKQAGDSRGHLGQIINDVKRLMTFANQWKIQHVRKTTNEVAHQLVKMGLEYNEFHIWIRDFPVCMNEVILAEQDDG